MEHIIHLSVIDWIIMAVYLAFIIWIGFYLKKYVKSDKDFFLAGRKNSAWVAGIAFMSANMGAMEVIGYSGQAVKFGISTAQFYLIGAIPAMLFLGIFMMPFYYKNKIKSVPGYIRERFDEKTRLLNAIAFAVMMVLVSGIALYALALVLHTFIGWDWNLCIFVSAGLVALYVSLSGLLSAIFTEIIQFFLIWAGIMLIPISGLIDLGSPHQIASRLSHAYTVLWSTTGSAATNPMHVTWYGLVLGLGFAVSFGYWTTDFLIIQRAFSAKDLRSAKLAPIIGTFFKMLLGVVVVGSGLVALSLLHDPNSGFTLLHHGSKINYDSVIPMLMMRYFPSGMIGLGVTTLVAMFMAGQAGNMSAFTTVWTYDIYQAVIDKDASPEKLMWVGRVATIVGIILSIGAAYWARSMPTIIDFLQAIVSFILAPTAAVILLGMFWKKITPTAAFWGMLIGMVSSFIMFVLLEAGLITPSAITPSAAASPMAANFWRAWWACMIAGIITIGGSFLTAARPEEELKGLVKGLGSKKMDVEAQLGKGHLETAGGPVGNTETMVETVTKKYKFYQTPEFWALVSLAIFIFWNVWFW
jgi:SSS family solute:Na+ symporter